MYQGGHVIDENGKVICQQGGYDCLIEEVGTTQYNVSGTIYTVFKKNGTVIDENGKVIVSSGGYEALIEYLKKGSQEVVINNTTYISYSNGTVTTIDGEVITIDGGVDEL